MPIVAPYWCLVAARWSNPCPDPQMTGEARPGGNVSLVGVCWLVVLVGGLYGGNMGYEVESMNMIDPSIDRVVRVLIAV
jgi:hypothetical protein